MATLHRDLTGTELHEPKGVAAAPAGKVYVSDGAGSGSWSDLPGSGVSFTDTTLVSTNVSAAIKELRDSEINTLVVMADVSNPSTVLIPISFDCTLLGIEFTLGGAITVANSGLTITRSDGAAMGTATIAFSGSAEGITVSFAPSGNNVLDYPTHRYIKIVSDGNSTTTAPLYCLARFKRT